MHTVLAVLVLLMIELAVALVLLGTWIAEGRRREEEIERLSGLVETFSARTGAPANGRPGGSAGADPNPSIR